MNATEIRDRLTEKFGDDVIQQWTDQIAAGSDADTALKKKDYRPRDAFGVIKAEDVAEVMLFLRDDPDLAFDFMQNLTGVDYPTDGKLDGHGPSDTMAVIYHLYSYRQRHDFVLKTYLPRDNPHVSSVASIWPVANWHERECYDLCGVLFDGHPDLRRIMLPEEFEGHPMRKTYVERPTVLGIPTTRFSSLGLLGKLVE